MPNSAGNVQSRRSHTKSRKGCKTCKRRHIRCDENFPQCRNCSKHNVVCDYMESNMEGEASTLMDVPDLNITPQVQQDLDRWKETHIFPFPTLNIINQPSPITYSSTDLRLIHHISAIAAQMQAAEPNNYAIWTKRVPTFLTIATGHDFVMHSLLGLSASHLSWLTTCRATLQLAYQHRGLAFQGLHEAIGNFSKQNADAVLAASVLLSWQVTDWRSWASLLQGTSTVIDAMQGWKHESEFKEFMEEKDIYSRGTFRPQLQIPDPERDRQALTHVYNSLIRLEPAFAGKEEEAKGLHDLVVFIQQLQTRLPVQSAEEQFEYLHPLRSWLFFLPIGFLKRVKQDPNVMILLAHFYGVALAVEPLFPAIGAAYFGTMFIGPIEELYQSLLAKQSQAGEGESIQWAIDLMEFPLDMMQKFRSRMDWRRADDLPTPTTAEGDALDLDSGTVPRSLHSSLSPAFRAFDFSFYNDSGSIGTPATDAGETPTSIGPNVHGSVAASGFMACTRWAQDG